MAKLTMKTYLKLLGIIAWVILLQTGCVLAGQTKTNNAPETLQAMADKIHAKFAAYSKTDNYQLLLDAAEIADDLYPETWPREMTGQVEQMLQIRIETIKAIDSAIDKAFDPKSPKNRVFINVAPPVMPTNPPGPIMSGMDPAGIADPVARRAYEEAIQDNSKKGAKLNREIYLKRAFDRCVNSTWIFLLNLRGDAPLDRNGIQHSLVYQKGIQIVEESIKDTNIVRKLKREGIGSPE